MISSNVNYFDHFFLGELEKSEFLLHIALKLAQDLQVEASITLVVAQNVVKVGLNRKKIGPWPTNFSFLNIGNVFNLFNLFEQCWLYKPRQKFYTM